MLYCSVKEVLDMIKEDMLNTIIGDEYIEEEEKKLEKMFALAETAIQDAEAEIDGYLTKRYKLPFQNPPNVLNKFSKDIAVYNLVSRTGIDEGEREKTFLNRYHAATKFLENIAKGIIDIGMGEHGTTESAANGFSMNSSQRLFSRQSMKGW